MNYVSEMYTQAELIGNLTDRGFEEVAYSMEDEHAIYYDTKNSEVKIEHEELRMSEKVNGKEDWVEFDSFEVDGYEWEDEEEDEE
jgi:hypothetical protein